MSSRRRRALVSVFCKEGVTDLCRRLGTLGYEILSTGGTARHLAGAGIPVTPIEEVTGFPEILDGRVKTLHPLVHGAILFRRELERHVEEAGRHGMVPIDLVVVNLYPFAETASLSGTPEDEVTEMIDIGGPSMVRAAAKNHASVTVLVSPADYGPILEELERDGDTSPETRRRLAARTFQHCATYDATVAGWLAGAEPSLPAIWHPLYERTAELRYGENPHQRAALYRETSTAAESILAAEVLQGRQLSFNNYLDLDAAWALLAEFDEPAAVIVKHNNPCGVARDADPAAAYLAAREADPTSAFGGIVALNREVGTAAAEAISSTFVEAVVAPAYTADARTILGRKKKLRLLRTGAPPQPVAGPLLDFRRISGGLLLQDADSDPGDADWRVVTRRSPTDVEQRALVFAWKVVRHVRSNAMVYAAPDRTLGIGAGQMSRVDAARLGVEKARSSLQGAALASDAFLPFRDSVDSAAEAGVAAIIQPGGSIRDEEVIDAADGSGMAMIFTGVRHFRH